MSSATSTKPRAEPVADAAPRIRVRVPWTIVTPVALAGAVALYLFALMEPRAPLSAGTVFLVAAAAAFGAVALQIWKAISAVVSDRESEESQKIRSDRRRRELEREKAAILKAIKELEFDHKMGKISDADYNDAHANYRQRAVRIMAQLEAGSAGYREIIERELGERLARRGSKKAEPVAEKAEPVAEKAEPVAEKDPAACACGTRNDPDAVFCKKCGARLQEGAA